MQLAKAIIQEIRATPRASKKRSWDQFKSQYPHELPQTDVSPIRKRKVDLIGDYGNQRYVTTTTGGNATTLLNPDSHQIRPPNLDTGLVQDAKQEDRPLNL